MVGLTIFPLILVPVSDKPFLLCSLFTRPFAHLPSSGLTKRSGEPHCRPKSYPLLHISVPTLDDGTRTGSPGDQLTG
jgi:hypothetical protein